MSEWSYAEDVPKEKKITSNTGSGWSYAEPEKPESFMQKLPRNMGAGLANLGHTLLNTPYGLAQNFKQLGQEWNQGLDQAGLSQFKMPNNNLNVADRIPHQQEYNFAEMLGQKGEPTWSDWGIQKGVEYSPELALGAGLAKNAFKGVIPHLTQKGAAKTLSRAKQLASERNIGRIKVDPKLIKDAAQFLPKTAPYKNALKEAKTGNYNSLFKLQTDLGKHAGDYASSEFSAAERAHGRAGMATRNAILDEMHKGLQAQGHNDISNLLRQGQREYAKYKKFVPLRNKIIKGAVIAGGFSQLPQVPIVNHLLKDALLSNIK